MCVFVTFCLLFLVVRDVLVPIILYILVVLLGSLNSGTRILLVLLVLKARSLLSLRSDFLIVRFFCVFFLFFIQDCVLQVWSGIVKSAVSAYVLGELGFPEDAQERF